MKPIPAIVESDVARHAAAVDQAIRNLREAQQHEESAESRWNTARHVTARMRVELGHALAAARKSFPKSGRNAKGWTDFLRVRGIDPDVADDTMKYAGHIDEHFSGAVPEKPPTMREAGIDRRPLAAERDDDDEPEPVFDQERDTPPFRQMTESEWIQGLGRLNPEVRSRIMAAAGPLPTPALELTLEPDPDDTANVHGGSNERERGTWCTSKEWAAAVGAWDLDPFSNPRSHILSVVRCMLEDGGDAFGGGPPGARPGLYLTGNAHGAQPASGVADELTRVWIQPPYELVPQAIAHYGHTRFCALLRWSPDVKAWFPELWRRTAVVCHPWGERMEFEPPPSLKKKHGDMPFPHALYYAHEADVTDEVRAKCIVWRVDHDFDPRGDRPALQLVR